MLPNIINDIMQSIKHSKHWHQYVRMSHIEVTSVRQWAEVRYIYGDVTYTAQLTT